jgi:hypothetical protein
MKKKQKVKSLFQVNVPVGNLSPTNVQKYCEKIRKTFKKIKFRKKYGEIIIFPVNYALVMKSSG